MGGSANVPAIAVQRGEGKELIPGFVVLKASAAETEGAFEVFEVKGPSGPPPHIHQHHQELFYIAQGTFEFTIGEDVIEAAAGSVVLVPRNTRHGFKTEADASALVFVAPAGLEGFFAELGAGIAAGTSDAELRRALEAKYDSHPA